MSKDEERPKYYRASEAARILSLSLPTLRKYASEGKIKSFLTPGKRYRYEIDSFLSVATTVTDAVHKRKQAKQQELAFMEEADKANERKANVEAD